LVKVDLTFWKSKLLRLCKRANDEKKIIKQSNQFISILWLWQNNDLNYSVWLQENSHIFTNKFKNLTIFLYFVYVDKNNEEESVLHSIDNHNFQNPTDDNDASQGAG